jgi:hypothetical protein
MESTNYIQIISIPRSGQHLLERLLKKVHEYYNIPFSYCEFYSCCQAIPCKKGARYLKNHDFSLTVKKTLQTKFIVLYRKNAISQMESIFRFNKSNNVNYESKKDFNEFIEYYRDTISYYYGFILKWVENHKDNVLLIEYENFCENPAEILYKILKFSDIRSVKVADVDFILNDFEKIESKSIDRIFYKKVAEEVLGDSYISKLFKLISKIRVNRINIWNIRLLIGYLISKY